MTTVRLTMAQALTRYMAAQQIRQFDGSAAPAFAGVWAIFGHGNVAGMGEALHGAACGAVGSSSASPSYFGTMTDGTQELRSWIGVQADSTDFCTTLLLL